MSKKNRKRKPNNKPARGNRGKTVRASQKAETGEALQKAFMLHQQGDLDSAERGYTELLKMDPLNANAMHLLGVIELSRGNYQKAERQIVRAVKIVDREPIFYTNLGTAQLRQGRADEAIVNYEKSLALNPEYPNAHLNLGTALKEKGDLVSAGSHLSKAIQLMPGSAEAHYNIGTVYQGQAKIMEAVSAYEKALNLNPDLEEAWSNYLFSLNYLPDIDPATVSAMHRKWGGRFEKSEKELTIKYSDTPTLKKVLRIGYVSPDFRNHSVAFFTLPIFENHDRSKFEIFGYSDVKQPDGITEKFELVSDHWCVIEGMNDQQVYERIRQDKIDILVDLAGHTGKNRLKVFARKPAPVQVSYLGYPNTTGLETIDYRITDNIADPEGLTDNLYTENLIRLKDCFLCYRNFSHIPIVENQSGKEEDSVTFGSFNTGMKINDDVIRLWSEILKAVPNSRLVLKAKHFNDRAIIEDWKSKFIAQGVSISQLDFLGFLLSSEDHLQLYNSIDIALDTFPYTGTTTTCEALWMGVPVITLTGKHHASRVSASILTTFGMEEYVADDMEAYIEIAVNKAQDIKEIRNSKIMFREKLTSSALMNEKVFLLELENAYQQMWTQQYSKDLV